MSTEKAQSPVERQESRSDDEDMEEDSLIAADLTLYSNPLNRYLTQTDTDKNKKRFTHDDHKDEIAADLNKYDSPLATLDAMHEKKHKHDHDQEHGEHHHKHHKHHHHPHNKEHRESCEGSKEGEK